MKKMFLRGSGPGLTWDKSIEMKKSAREVDVWAADVHYRSDTEGLFCRNPIHCNFNQEAVQWSFIYTGMSRQKME